MISAALAIIEDDIQRNELAEFYLKNKNTFYLIAYSKLHNKFDAEDAIQNAFLSIASNPNLFFAIPDKDKLTYVNVIIRNKAYDILYTKKKIEDNEVKYISNTLTEQIDVENLIISEQNFELILNYIDTFSEKTKAVFYMKNELNMKHSDIAKILEITEAASKKRFSRAIVNIKHFLEELNNE